MIFEEFSAQELDVKSIYHLLISGISPRPIALVGTLDSKGNSNLAPFSFFNAFGANPPIVGFSPALSGRTGLPKDTLLNIQETKEFTISIVNSSMVEQISLSSCEFDRHVDEFKKAGFTKLHSKKIKSFGVQESNFIMECKLRNIIKLGEKPASGNLILGEVLQFSISKSVLTDTNQIDPHKLDPIARNGGSWYNEEKKGLFEVKKPRNIGVGFDAIPDKIKKSQYFSGNELAKLASIESIPKKIDTFLAYDNNLYDICKNKLVQNKIEEAWQIVFLILEND